MQRGTKQEEVKKRVLAWTSKLAQNDDLVWTELLEVSIDDKRLMLQALITEATLGGHFRRKLEEVLGASCGITSEFGRNPKGIL